MATQNKTPRVNERFVTATGFAVDQFYRWCQWVTGELRIKKDSIYADLAAIDAAIPSPQAGQRVFVTGQGMATYTGSAWVKSADGTTFIT